MLCEYNVNCHGSYYSSIISIHFESKYGVFEANKNVPSARNVWKRRGFTSRFADSLIPSYKTKGTFFASVDCQRYGQGAYQCLISAIDSSIMVLPYAVNLS